MKRMFIYALLFLGTAILCLLAVYGITRYQLRQEEPIPNTILESETVPDMEGREALNQDGVQPAAQTVARVPEEEYFLVSEAGFLLVFCSDVYPYPSDGFSGAGESQVNGRNMVSDHDGRISLSGILYKLRTGFAWICYPRGRGRQLFRP